MEFNSGVGTRVLRVIFNEYYVICYQKHSCSIYPGNTAYIGSLYIVSNLSYLDFVKSKFRGLIQEANPQHYALITVDGYVNAILVAAPSFS